MGRTALRIDRYDTWGDWGLLLAAGWTLDEAEVKRETVDRPDGDGVIDFTGAVTGYPNYGNRAFNGNLILLPDRRQNWEITRKIIANKINGTRHRLILPDDEEHYLMGTITMGTPTFSSGARRFAATYPITADCDPYKYKNRLTEISYDNVTTLEITLRSERMPAVPTILSSQALTVKSDNGTTLQISANVAREYPELILINEETAWVLTSAQPATVTITYQEGSL
ncbi:hypothetical protein OfM1_18790 [Lactovum odontotermitis]